MGRDHPGLDVGPEVSDVKVPPGIVELRDVGGHADGVMAVNFQHQAGGHAQAYFLDLVLGVQQTHEDVAAKLGRDHPGLDVGPEVSDVKVPPGIVELRDVGGHADGVMAVNFQHQAGGHAQAYFFRYSSDTISILLGPFTYLVAELSPVELVTDVYATLGIVEIIDELYRSSRLAIYIEDLGRKYCPASATGGDHGIRQAPSARGDAEVAAEAASVDILTGSTASAIEKLFNSPSASLGARVSGHNESILNSFVSQYIPPSREMTKDLTELWESELFNTFKLTPVVDNQGQRLYVRYSSDTISILRGLTPLGCCRRDPGRPAAETPWSGSSLDRAPSPSLGH